MAKITANEAIFYNICLTVVKILFLSQHKNNNSDELRTLFSLFSTKLCTV